jgi:hypothetical protein
MVVINSKNYITKNLRRLTRVIETSSDGKGGKIAVIVMSWNI